MARNPGRPRHGRPRLAGYVAAAVTVIVASGCGGAAKSASSSSTPAASASSTPTGDANTAAARLNAAQAALQSDVTLLTSITGTDDHLTSATTAIGRVKHVMGPLREAAKAGNCPEARKQLGQVTDGAATGLSAIKGFPEWVVAANAQLGKVAKDVAEVAAAGKAVGPSAAKTVADAQNLYKAAQTAAAAAEKTGAASAASTTATINGLVATANQVVVGRRC